MDSSNLSTQSQILSEQHNGQPNKQRDYLFSDVILCVKTDIGTFNCHRFNTYIGADKYFNTHYKNNNNKVICSTMLPMCIFMPKFLQKIVLQHKTAKIFNKINI